MKPFFLSQLRNLCWPAVIALVAFVAIVISLDPAGSYPRSFAGPGLTIDEVFNVEQGAYLVEGIRGFGWGLLHPASWMEIFGQPVYLHDHPPLGRLMLGLSHETVRSVFPPVEIDSRFTTAAARPASALAFALLVLLVGSVTANWFGRAVGIVAAISLVLMPRLFGHAHLAALESWLNLTYVACVLGTIHFWTRHLSDETAAHHIPSHKTALCTGLLFGLALLTKIQAVLIPIPFILWSLWRWRWKGMIPLAIWGATGFVVFFLGWPWLWIDPLDHLAAYFGQTTDRVSLNAWYFGERFADKNVPWHYSFVMFLTTIPVAFHLLAGWGVIRMWRTTDTDAVTRQRTGLVIGSALWPLIMFSLPGIAVYDSERLFLCSFPLWSVMIGRGGVFLWDALRQRMSPRTTAVVFSVALATQSVGLFASSPTFLGHYNVLVGGPRGAAALGLETSYWGEGLTREFFDRVVKAVPQGAEVTIGPIMHPMQIPDWERQIVSLRQHAVKLKPWDPAHVTPKYLILYSRKADLPPEWRTSPPGNAKLLVSEQQQGVVLAALYELQSE
ncbi:MAG: glycosyltransferase family 39 protein [Planctomycetota bacterium]|nr:glycosyltransferase family 39 protein [Planctomycetota bacterium]MDA1211310.1 glycosyltransferase family 39 protein [Planctomycetota bacterium]